MRTLYDKPNFIHVFLNRIGRQTPEQNERRYYSSIVRNFLHTSSVKNGNHVTYIRESIFLVSDINFSILNLNNLSQTKQYGCLMMHLHKRYT